MWTIHLQKGTDYQNLKYLTVIISFPGHHNKEEEFRFELIFISSRVLARVRDGNSITKDFATPSKLLHLYISW